MMKEVKAFIKPNRVHNVANALKEAGFESVTISKGEGTGAYKNRKYQFPHYTVEVELNEENCSLR